jgi:hypothetical protein
MSEIPNAAKGAAREKMREAKARGETLKYTDALASVLDTEVVEQSPNIKLVSRLRAALNHLNEALRDNPCFTDETRRQARTVVTTIIRSHEDDVPKAFPVCVRGYKGTGTDHIVNSVYASLVKGGVVPEAEPVEQDFAGQPYTAPDIPSFINAANRYPDDVPHGVASLNRMLKRTFSSSDFRKNTNVVVFLETPRSDRNVEHYRLIPNRIDTHLPSYDDMVKNAESVAVSHGYRLTDAAKSEFKDAMKAVQEANDEEFYNREDWRKVIQTLVARAVDVHLDKLIAKDTDDFDTNVYAEDINQAAKDMFFVDYGPAIPDENPSPTILTSAWGDGRKRATYFGPDGVEKKTGKDWTPEWNWTNRANKFVPMGTELDPERGIPAHDVVSVQLRGNGIISGFQGSGYVNMARNFIISSAAHYSPQELCFAVFNGKEEGPIQVKGAKLGVSRIPHVVKESDDEEDFFSWITMMSKVIQTASDEGRKEPKLCVVIVGRLSEIMQRAVVDAKSTITFVQVSPIVDIPVAWGVIMAGSQIVQFPEINTPGTGNAALVEFPMDQLNTRTAEPVFRMFGDEDVSELIDRICDYHASMKQS